MDSVFVIRWLNIYFLGDYHLNLFFKFIKGSFFLFLDVFFHRVLFGVSAIVEGYNGF